jgi:hypothetical protein
MHQQLIQFVFNSSLQEDSCLIYVICVCLSIFVSNTYCVVVFVCLSIFVSNTYCVVVFVCLSSSYVRFLPVSVNCSLLIALSLLANVYKVM